MIDDFWTGDEARAGCFKLMQVVSLDGNVVNFVVQPTTYFVDHVMVALGDMATGFYDANAPTPLIYPPQFQAIVMARVTPNQNVKVDIKSLFCVIENESNHDIFNPFLLLLNKNLNSFG